MRPESAPFCGTITERKHLPWNDLHVNLHKKRVSFGFNIYQHDTHCCSIFTLINSFLHYPRCCSTSYCSGIYAAFD